MLTGCSEYRPRLIEMARGLVAPDERRALMAHVEMCADCARALDDQLALSAALAGLADEALPEMAAIEVRVLAEFDHEAARRRSASRWIFAAGLAAAALVGLVALQRRTPEVRPGVAPAVVVEQAPVSVATPVVVSRRPATAISRVRHTLAKRPEVEEGQPFVPIPYTVPLAPEEQATVVHMQVSVAALISAGFNVTTSDPGAAIDADVLVSQDGRARAIRFNSRESKEEE